MTLSAVVLDVEPDAVSVARRLAGRPGFVFLHAASGDLAGRRSFIGVEPVEVSVDPLPPIAQRVASASVAGDTRTDVPRWVGAVPYEQGRSLERLTWTRNPDLRARPHLVAPRWRRYAAIVEVDPDFGVVRVIGDDPARVTDLAREVTRRRPEREGVAGLCPLPEDEPDSAHIERIRIAQRLIGAGDLYQVNLARRRRLWVVGRPLDLYLAIASRSPAPFGACLDLGGTVVCASSPELFLSIDSAGRLLTGPIKGTRPRGVDADDDRRLARELDESAKEQAELTMILDVERNDLGKVAVPGSVRLVRGPAVESHRTIHHRSALLAAFLRPDRTPLDVLLATFPSGSVTGAPKVRAMEVIARLEPVRRGLYTGAFGYVGFDGSVRLAMAIRVLTIQGAAGLDAAHRQEAHYFAGGGIVADSDPEAELAETRWKTTQIEDLVRGAPGKLA